MREILPLRQSLPVLAGCDVSANVMESASFHRKESNFHRKESNFLLT